MPANREPDSLAKIFVGGLASTTDENSLREFYEQWGGEITDIVVMRDPATKRSRGFGFVTFATDDQVDAAMANRPHVINGKQVDPKRAVPREFQNKAEAQLPSKKVYVGGVKPEHTEEVLQEYFSQYGKVTEIDIVEDKKTGQKRGFAFVVFDDHDPADKVVLMRYHNIVGKRCECKKAASREELAKLQQQGDSVARGARSGRGGYGGYNNGAANGYGGPRGGGDWNNQYSGGYSNQYAGANQWGQGAPQMANPYGGGQGYQAPGQGGYNGYSQGAQQGYVYSASAGGYPAAANAAPGAAGGYGTPSAAAYGSAGTTPSSAGGYGGYDAGATGAQGGYSAAGGKPAYSGGAYGGAGYGAVQSQGAQPQGWRNAGSSWGGAGRS